MIPKSLLTTFLYLWLANYAFAQLPTSISNSKAYTDWADYDNDGDQDILFSFIPDGSTIATTKILINTNGVFTASANTLNSNFGRVKWADIDNDGDLDFAQIGSNAGIYLNNGNGNFTQTADVIANYVEDLAWGDYDNDGDEDLVVAGTTGGNYYDLANIHLYQNNNGSFSEVTGFLPLANDLYNIYDITWVDYDNDGDMDLSFSNGYGGDGTFPTVQGVFVLTNNNGTFTDSGILLNGWNSAWSDYDQDGDLDVGCGKSLVSPTQSIIFANTGSNSFNDSIQVTLITLAHTGLAEWGDWDNDGDPDLAIGGGLDSEPVIGRILINNGTSFSTSGPLLASSKTPTSGGFADYDNDGDLDFLISGVDGYFGAETFFTNLFTNTSTAVNTTPSIPTGLSVSFANTGCGVVSDATFSWNASTDSETAPVALTYNLRVGTTPGGSEILSITNSLQPKMGNVQNNTSWTIKGLDAGINYYWSVEAVDHGYAHSGFAAEQVYNPPISNTLFTDAGISLSGIGVGSVEWGDYDGDGDLDILTAGNLQSGGTTGMADIYRNDNGVFTPINAGFVPVTEGKAVFVDFDNDNDLDVALMGRNSGGFPILNIYRNTNSGFLNLLNTNLPGVYEGSMDWADFDNNGYPDLAVMGKDNANQPLTKVFTNSGSAFIEYSATTFPGLYDGDVAWHDRSQGFMDLIISGKDAGGNDITHYYNNASGQLNLLSSSLTNIPQVSNSSIAENNISPPFFYEYMIMGSSAAGEHMYHFVYDGQTEAAKPGLANGDVVWLDYDNDGDNDAVISGLDLAQNAVRTLLYENVNESYSLVCNGFPMEGNAGSRIATGDYDNDGDLDLLFTSFDNTGQAFARIYDNGSTISNISPAAPTGLTTSLSCSTLTFQWNRAIDNETNAISLTYNLRVGTSPGASDIVSPSATATGYHAQSTIGNMGLSTRYTIPIQLNSGTAYYWSVQTIDNGYAASVFSTEEGILPDTVQSVAFTEISTAIEGRIEPDMHWVDYDLDGDLDLYITGYDRSINDPNAQSDASLYTNNGNGIFSKADTPFPSFADGLWLPPGEKASVWADFDNDGDPDLALTTLNPHVTGGDPRLVIYRNDGNSFTEQVNLAHTENAHKKILLNDYDADGDEDIFLFSNTDSYVFQNQGNFNFTRFHFYELNRYQNSDLALFDIGRSLLLTTYQPDSTQQFNTKMHLLELLGVLSEYEAYYQFPSQLSAASVAGADYDFDGDTDILMSGVEAPGGSPKTVIYRNENNASYTEMAGNLLPMGQGSVHNNWVDIDGDGDADILSYGEVPTPLNGQTWPLIIYKNDGNDQFVQANHCFPEVLEGNFSTIDIDSDSDLDILLTGKDPLTGTPVTYLFQNDEPITNTPPTPPTFINVSYHPEVNSINFAWQGATDAETPEEGLKYNIRIGTTPSGSEVKFGNAHIIVAPTNSREATGNWLRKDVVPGQTYYYAVQSVDPGKQASVFSEEGQFTVPNPFSKNELNIDSRRPLETYWGDYDADGDMDLLAIDKQNRDHSKIFRNDNGQLVDIQFAFPLTKGKASPWWDFDGDGDLDLVLDVIPDTITTTVGTYIYENVGGDQFVLHETYINSSLPSDAGVYWVPIDYDNDGHMDLINRTYHYTMVQPRLGVIKLFQNDGNDNFTEIPGAFSHNANEEFIGSIDGISDIDGNGYKDLILSTMDNDSTYIYLYKNTGTYDSSLTLVTNVRFRQPGKVSFGDWDNDGDIDFYMGKFRSGTDTNRSGWFINNGGDQFTHSANYLVRDFEYVLGDMDNDGALNLIFPYHFPIQGQPKYGIIIGSSPTSHLPTSGMRALDNFSFVDFDNDGDLDGFASGLEWHYIFQDSTLSIQKSIVWLNDSAQVNNPPVAPSGLGASYNPINQSITFSWSATTDDHTPSPGLTYNIRIGKSPNAIDVVGPSSIVAPGTPLDGRRQIVAIGNIGQVTSWRLNDVQPGQSYYWSVQAIDHSYKGSAFATEQVAASNISNGTGTLAGVMGTGSGGSSGGRVVNGRKMDVDEPIADALIALVNVQLQDTTLLDVTDVAGNFDFSGIPEGDYQLYVDYNGLPMDADNPIINFTDGQENFEVTILVGDDNIGISLNARVTAIDNEILADAFEIFPNPAKGQVTISSNGIRRDITVQILDLNGHLKDSTDFDKNNTSVSFKIDSYPTGVYIIRIITGIEILNYKLIKR